MSGTDELGRVAVHTEAGAAVVSVGGAERWTYRWGHRKKPHVHPLRSPAGHVLTVAEPDDHPWQRGLWSSIKFVDGDNFWEEVAPYGVQRHDGAPAVELEPAAGRVQVDGSLTWIRPDRSTVAVREHRTLTHTELGDGAYALDVEQHLTFPNATRLDRTPYTTWGGYSGLTLRGAPDWTGTSLTAEGAERVASLAGHRSPWCHLTGELDGQPVGVACFDHPDNPRHPTPWYGSTRNPLYGTGGWTNFLNAAFLFHEPMDVPAAGTLSFRHRLVVHDGGWSAARVAAAWGEWASP